MRMEESELTADKIKELSRYGLTVGVCTDNAQYFGVHMGDTYMMQSELENTSQSISLDNQEH